MEKKHDITGVPTGITVLDEILLGLPPSDLILIEKASKKSHVFKQILNGVFLTNMKKGFIAMVLCLICTLSGCTWYNFCDNTVAKLDSISMVVPEEPVDPYNGHEYVDLGLSVKWATMNVGAESPEDYGDYFAWGEVEPKETYDWSTYKWCNGTEDTQTKYCTDSSYGTVDNKTVLETADDAATANWGGNWRMPTKAEQDELDTECTWIWTTENGVNGYRVTSNKAGYTDKSIFLPVAGRRHSSDLYHAGDYGSYWSSSIETDYLDKPWYLSFCSSTLVCFDFLARDCGRSIRPVCQ